MILSTDNRKGPGYLTFQPRFGTMICASQSVNTEIYYISIMSIIFVFVAQQKSCRKS